MRPRRLAIAASEPVSRAKSLASVRQRLRLRLMACPSRPCLTTFRPAPCTAITNNAQKISPTTLQRLVQRGKLLERPRDRAAPSRANAPENPR